MPKRRVGLTRGLGAKGELDEEKPSIHRIMINKPTFDTFAGVIAAVSCRDGKFKTQKQVIVEGLDCLIRSTVFERFIAMSTYDPREFRGDLSFFFQFDGNEKRLVHETRTLLQQESGAKLKTHDTLVLALLAAAKANGAGEIPV